jgi:hypothetical protein
LTDFFFPIKKASVDGKTFPTQNKTHKNEPKSLKHTAFHYRMPRQPEWQHTALKWGTDGETGYLVLGRGGFLAPFPEPIRVGSNL